uniref:NUDIX domain-containing protein n=1 Tax=Aliarcobacter sp. TaxID=2321116 RepID=UPI004048254E
MLTLKTVVKNTPLISVDFIVKNSENKILLGKRVNEPAKNHLFTLGGRVYKNEKLDDAKKRILKDELGFLSLNTFIIIVLLMIIYVNLAYEIDVSYIQDLPQTQHNSYIWLSLNELINSNEVHKYVKEQLIWLIKK